MQLTDSEMDTDSDAKPTDRPYTTDLKQDQTTADIDWAPSEEQMYRETMHGIKFFMGWKHVANVNTDADNNPFAGLEQQLVGKISVKLATDD